MLTFSIFVKVWVVSAIEPLTPYSSPHPSRPTPHPWNSHTQLRMGIWEYLEIKLSEESRDPTNSTHRLHHIYNSRHKVESVEPPLLSGIGRPQLAAIKESRQDTSLVHMLPTLGASFFFFLLVHVLSVLTSVLLF